MLSAVHRALTTIDPVDRTRAELCDQIEALAKVESHVVERRLAVTAAIDALDDGGVDGANVNRSVGRCSGRRAAQLVAAAAALGEMPATRAALAAGTITPEHADAAARAAADIDPHRADAELPALAMAMPADLFAKRAREWVGRNQDPVDAESAHAAHRAARTARSWTDAEGMINLLLRGDAVSMAEIESAWTAKTDQLWRDDGGCDGSPEGIRTTDQRRYDAGKYSPEPDLSPEQPEPGPLPRIPCHLTTETARALTSGAMGQIQDRNKEIVTRYWDALYAHDWEGIKTFFTADANYVDTGIGEAGGGAHGPDQIVARLRLGLEPTSGHRHELGRLIAEDDAVVTEHAEEWQWPTGEVVMHPFTSVMELDDDGKITRWWDYSNIGNLIDNAPQWWLDHIAQGWNDT